MTRRERVKTIFSGRPADRCGFWLGNPHAETWPILLDYFGADTQQAVREKLGDDYAWICPQFFDGAYVHPDGHGMFTDIPQKKSHGQAGPFADCEDPAEVDDFPWPEARYCRFEPCIEALRSAGDVYRAGGMWTCFYHNVMDMFGMDNYMVKMYMHPEVVDAVTDRVCEFYYEANERFYAEAGDLVDGYFFGNDFGTQLDLICSPGHFDRYIKPWFERFTEQAHARGLQVILHSCGAIAKVIDRLIEFGVDALHPLQALAAGMDAESIAAKYAGRIAFMGGIDTQQLLIHGTPDDIRAEVRRVKRVLGPCLVVSPSHEAVLPNVPPENIAAMARATVED